MIEPKKIHHAIEAALSKGDIPTLLTSTAESVGNPMMPSHGKKLLSRPPSFADRNDYLNVPMAQAGTPKL